MTYLISVATGLTTATAALGFMTLSVGSLSWFSWKAVYGCYANKRYRKSLTKGQK